MTLYTHAQNKLDRCLILAHDCSRDSWDHSRSPTHRREYKRLRHEAMQDARYWRDVIRKNLEY